MRGAELSVVPPPVTPARRPGIAETDKAWMAAVVDLKGAIVRKNNKMRRTPQFVLTLSTKNPAIAVRLSALTGTAPEPHPNRAEEFMRRGCAEHCLVLHVHVSEYPWRMPPVTRWSITGIAAAVVLVNLAPYMSTYDEYAGDVSEILATFAATGQGSGAVRATVTRLANRGWKIPLSVRRRMGS